MQATISQLISLLAHHYPKAPWHKSRWQSQGGGSIHHAFRVENELGVFFLKTHQAAALESFQAEADNLAALAEAFSENLSAKNIFKKPLAIIPQPLAVGSDGQQAFLLLPYLELSCQSNAAMGLALAQLHRQTATYFGWPKDNFIGGSLQKNGHYASWPRFWQEQRLAFQRQLLINQGYTGRFLDTLERLIADCPVFFKNYQPVASLLHGDLWSGNAALTLDNQPVFFDPACYYGDREADVAMSALFGGFSLDFYSAYREAWPLDLGFSVRKTLYNLYHLLNHLQLFGNSYQGAVERTIYQLRSEL